MPGLHDEAEGAGFSVCVCVSVGTSFIEPLHSSQSDFKIRRAQPWLYCVLNESWELSSSVFDSLKL